MNASAATPSPPDPAAPAPRCVVLLVDDHADTLAMLCRLLRSQGHAVLDCADCAAARAAAEAALARGERVDVIIGDISLPDGDGVDLMCALKTRLGCVAIALTGHGMEEDVQRCAEAGIDRHLLKPVGVRELDASIRNLAGC